jgi:hypothetical protein
MLYPGTSSSPECRAGRAHKSYDRLTYQILANKPPPGASGYSSDFDAIAEILEYQIEPGTASPRLLRKPQLRALETYWYLRLVAGTPHILDLYRRLYPKPSELLAALGLDAAEITKFAFDNGLDALWARIRDDDAFVHDFKLESVRETLTLDYPSYILALAMGAGKTMLIGAIIATEFAMGLEYPDGLFVQNALVFAPGKTIECCANCWKCHTTRSCRRACTSRLQPP